MWKRAAAVAAMVAVALAGCSASGDEADDGWTRLAPAEVDQKVQRGEVYLVNVHIPYEGEIPGTDAFIPYQEITSRADELPADVSTLVLYCRSGSMSTEAARELVAAGVTGFAELDGGFDAWQAAGLPFENQSPAR